MVTVLFKPAKAFHSLTTRSLLIMWNTYSFIKNQRMIFGFLPGLNSSFTKNSVNVLSGVTWKHERVFFKRRIPKTITYQSEPYFWQLVALSWPVQIGSSRQPLKPTNVCNYYHVPPTPKRESLQLVFITETNPQNFQILLITAQTHNL